MKGILLAGGKGTRLYPMTQVASKQLQPIYDKPMVYYPLTTMMVAGLREILIISSPEDLPRFEQLLGDGSRWGVSLAYQEQAAPRGIAEALVLAETFLDGHKSMLMLGDNFIYGRLDFLREEVEQLKEGATVFGYRVADPSAYGVVEVDADFQVVSLEEKPKKPKSPWAVPGMYLYDEHAPAYAKALAPSARGELEITDLNRVYLENGQLRARPMGRGIAWLDTGTPENLLEASSFVHALQSRQGLIIGSPEEVAYRRGYLSHDAFAQLVQQLPRSVYRDYLEHVRDEGSVVAT